ncbi:O-antigen ligase family protein [Thorsellia kenyensis]|uniref:O-antigen ligase family protein n=1 Tax=Thorsellia kenyensis TaxID=1549888 RepID=A0ABV6CBH0_9GAMM
MNILQNQTVHNQLKSNTAISLITLFSIALVPLHTKIASASLILLSVFFVYQSVLGHLNAKILKPMRELTRNSSIILFEHIVKLWLAINLVAYGMKLMIQLYHDEFNDVSSFHSRNIILALFMYVCFVKFRVNNNLFIYLKYLPYPIFSLGIVTFIIGYVLWGNISFGTNQIPWAAGISIVSLSIHILMLQNLNNKWWQLLGWCNSLLILLTIFNIGVRGSYFYIVWLAFLMISSLFVIYRKKITLKSITIIVIIFFGLILLLSFFGQGILNNGLQRIEMAMVEIKKFIELGANGANTSVGARLHMWSESIQFIKTDFWLGHGKDTTVEIIKEIGMTANSSIIKGLNQVHNEFIQAILTYGILGIISLLLYPAALIYFAWLIRIDKPSISISLIGVVFLFLTAGMTNANTYHNYFGTAFSISIGLIMSLYLRSILYYNPRSGSETNL